MKVRHAIALATALVASGCNTYNVHAWAKRVPLDPDAELVAVGSLSGVKDLEIASAATLLENAEFVELDAANAARFAKGAPEPAAGEKVFLLRGVSWGTHPPMFRKVYIDRSTRTVYVIGYDWDGEILIPFATHNQVVSPLIASLPFTPENVIPGAWLGGDRIAGLDRDALHEWAPANATNR